MPIKGVCRVYEDDMLVAEANNLVTDYGKSRIPLMLAGQGGFVKEIGIGAATDAGLSYIKVEIAKAPIVFATPSYSSPNARIVYKARLNDDVAGVINEISLFDAVGGGKTIMTTSTREAGRVITGAVVDITGLAGNPSTGSNKVRLAETAASIPVGGSVEMIRPTSLAGAISTDSIMISGYNAAVDVDQATVTLLMTDAYGTTLSGTFAFAANTDAYQSVSKTISSFGATSFDWSRIEKTKFTVSGAGAPNVVVDGLTLRSDSATGRAMTRAVYGAPVVKRYGSRMDVEYELVIGL
jgi:hypothetical protein